MGKFRKTKKSGNNSRLNRPGRSEKLDEQIRNDKILPLIAKLKSANFRDRVVAMSAVNSMVDDPNYRQMLLREKLLQVIMSHSLSDQSQEIVAEGFGLLRNIVIEEGRDAAVYLYRQNILTTIKATIEKLQKVWNETNNLETLQGQQDKVIVREFTENIFGLICGLAMADDDIYDAVVELMDPLSGFLSQLLQSKFNLVHDVILEFLYVMSEDEQAATVIVNSGLQSIVQCHLEPQNVASQVYKLGITYNLLEVAQTGTEADLTQILQAIFNTVCEFDFSVVVPAVEMSSEPKKLKDAVLEQAHVRAQINASQVAFEIIASIMVSWGHISSPSRESLEFIGDKVAPLCIRALGYQNYALRACSSLNNICWTFNLLGVEWNVLAEQAWSAVAPLTSTDDVGLLASALGVLGAITQLFEGRVPFKLQEIELIAAHMVELRPPEINIAFDDTKEYAHMLRMWIPLVCRIGQIPENLDICALASSSIGVILETPNEFGPELTSVCINSLFELFGDNEAVSNQIYLERDINTKLQSLRPEFKRVLKSVDKSHTALREQCDETLLNLDRFIEYKATQRP